MNLTRLVKQQIFDAPLSSIQLEGKCIINTINPHSYVTAKKDLIFRKALIKSDILLPDGSGIVLASRVLCGKKIRKIAGADIHQDLLEKANLSGLKVFYLGASKSTLSIIRGKIQKEYPNIQVTNYSPPFKVDFSEEDSNEMIKRINNFNTDILFIGMTAPKQEKWVYRNKNKLNIKVAVSIGAVFDFYAGNNRRAPRWMIKIGMEWLHRSLGSWRLAKRNLISNPIFLKDLLIEKFL